MTIFRSSWYVAAVFPGRSQEIGAAAYQELLKIVKEDMALLEAVFQAV